MTPEPQQKKKPALGIIEAKDGISRHPDAPPINYNKQQQANHAPLNAIIQRKIVSIKSLAVAAKKGLSSAFSLFFTNLFKQKKKAKKSKKTLSSQKKQA